MLHVSGVADDFCHELLLDVLEGPQHVRVTPADILADHSPHADQFVLQGLLPGEGVLQVLRQRVQIVGRRDVARRPEQARF